LIDIKQKQVETGQDQYWGYRIEDREKEVLTGDQRIKEKCVLSGSPVMKQLDTDPIQEERPKRRQRNHQISHHLGIGCKFSHDLKNKIFPGMLVLACSGKEGAKVSYSLSIWNGE
jgi:hypothetical protein